MIGGVMFAMAGVALLLYSYPRQKVVPRLTGCWTGLVVAILGTLTLAGHYLAIRLKTQPGGPITDYPGLLTAVCFVSLGIGLFALDAKDRNKSWICESLFVAPIAISLLALIGYAFGYAPFYRWPSLEPKSAMALNSALAVVLLGGGGLCARPDRNLINVITGSSMGSTVARLLLLAPFIVPLASGQLHAFVKRTGFYNADFAGWSFSFLNIVLLTVIVWWVATLLHRTDSKIRELNTELEARVEARTADLVQTNQRLEEQFENRRRAEQALRESEETFRLMFFGNPLPMWAFNPETLQVIEVNDAALSQYGCTRDEFLRLRMSDIEVAEIQTDQSLGLQVNATNRSSGRHRLGNGKTIRVETVSHAFEFAGKPAVLFMANDITERLVLEEQLRQAQKMDSIGQLAGGVAHDFNNLLTVIQAHCSLLSISPKLTSEDLDSTHQIMLAADRAAGLTRQLLAFSRKQTVQARQLNLNTVVLSFCRMLGRVLGEDIQLRTVLAPELPPIDADQGMLEQVLLNLAVNSRDAMPNGGQLMIATTAVDLDQIHVPDFSELGESGYVCLLIADSGCGIPPEVLPRIFEPFFTTKGVGKGTGLGLATVYGIVRQHHGWITAASQPGQGAEFRVYLPVATRGEAESKGEILEIEMLKGTETILLVEDESTLRLIVQASLEREGYNVIEASSGPAARQIWQDRHDDIQIVVTDMIMPGGFTGMDLARQFQKERPMVRVILMSGYNIDGTDGGAIPRNGVCVLQKPFNPAKLLRTVRHCLDATCVMDCG